jgi:hypothetical protein
LAPNSFPSLFVFRYVKSGEKEREGSKGEEEKGSVGGEVGRGIKREVEVERDFNVIST